LHTCQAGVERVAAAQNEKKKRQQEAAERARRAAANAQLALERFRQQNNLDAPSTSAPAEALVEAHAHPSA